MKHPRPPALLFVTMVIALCGLMTSSADAQETLSVLEDSLTTTLHPFFARTMVDERVQELVFDRLLYRDPVTNALESRVLERFEVVDDGREVRLTLKEGITWHDGEPLDASDVCFTINVLLNPANPGWKAARAREFFEGCVEEEELQARVRFTRVFFNPGDRLNFRLIPAHVFDGQTVMNPESGFGSHPVGTGPYKAVLERRGVLLEAYPNAHHSATIPRVQIVERVDPFVALRQLEANGVQGIVRVPTQVYEQARALGASETEVVLKPHPSSQWWYIAVNTSRGALSEPRIRQALDMIIDRNELSRLSWGAAPNQLSAPAVKLISGPDLQSSPFYNPGVPTRLNANQGAAFALLNSTEGVSFVAGRWHYKGTPIELRIGMPAWLDEVAPDLLHHVGNQLDAAGFGRKVFKISPEEWDLKVFKGYALDYDLMIGAVGTSLSDTRMLLEGDLSPLFHTRRSGHGEQNIFNFSSPRIDALLDQFDAASTGTEALNARHELHKALAEELPMLYLWELGEVSAWRTEVRGNNLTPFYFWTTVDGWKYAP